MGDGHSQNCPDVQPAGTSPWLRASRYSHSPDSPDQTGTLLEDAFSAIAIAPAGFNGQSSLLIERPAVLEIEQFQAEPLDSCGHTKAKRRYLHPLDALFIFTCAYISPGLCSSRVFPAESLVCKRECLSAPPLCPAQPRSQSAQQ